MVKVTGWPAATLPASASGKPTFTTMWSRSRSVAKALEVEAPLPEEVLELDEALVPPPPTVWPDGEVDGRDRPRRRRLQRGGVDGLLGVAHVEGGLVDRRLGLGHGHRVDRRRRVLRRWPSGSWPGRASAGRRPGWPGPISSATLALAGSMVASTWPAVDLVARLHVDGGEDAAVHEVEVEGAGRLHRAAGRHGLRHRAHRGRHEPGGGLGRRAARGVDGAVGQAPGAHHRDGQRGVEDDRSSSHVHAAKRRAGA